MLGYQFEAAIGFRQFDLLGLHFLAILTLLFNQLVEFIELPTHPFWVGTQAHPEFKSRPDRPAPLFEAFISAAAIRAAGRNPQLLNIDEAQSIL